MTDLSSALRAIFDRHKNDHLARVVRLEQAVTAMIAGSRDEARRDAAQRDAHKLAGSLGTFGLHRASELAGELEATLMRSRHNLPSDDARMAECVIALREELDAGLGGPAPGDEPERGRPAGAALADVGAPAGQADGRRAVSGAIGDSRVAQTDAVELTRARVLVVDDDLPTQEALVSILSEAGYDVRGVGSGREARHALEHDAIDLLLSDVSMPGETGLDLIRYALAEHPQVATLLISALEDPGVAQAALDFGAHGYICKPARRSPVLIGVMNALRRREVEERERVTRDDLEQIVALRTRALSQAMEQLEHTAEHSRVLQAETIHRWARAAEYRDPGVGRHLTRMSRCCAVLAGKLGLHAESLELASVLHDVGKVAIPDRILLKPGPLTADERLAIETHAEIGYEMLRDASSSMLRLAAVIARTHHEKYDGSGYPHGLAGDDIPLEGRIAAVADVFDALTSDRVYRPRWTLDSALSWMRGERGKHFDPIVLDALLSSIHELRATDPAHARGRDRS